MLHAIAFLLDKIGVQSPIRGKILMSPGGGLQAIGTWVGIKYTHEGGPICYTGIPPHVVILIELQLIRTESREIRINLRSDLRAELDERSIGGVDISMARIQNLFQQFRDEIAEMNCRIDNGNGGGVGRRNSGNDGSTGQINNRHFWGGRWRAVPEGWKFQRNLSILAAWQAYHNGDETTPPLKYIKPIDLTDNVNVRGKSRPIRETEVRCLRDLVWLCSRLDTAAGVPSKHPTQAELVSLYHTPAVQLVLPPSTTNASRVRRVGEINWRRGVEELKKARINDSGDE